MRAVGVLIAIISGLLLLGTGAPAYAAPPAATIGPMEINPVGHPHLCWESTGNGAPVALENCDGSLHNQQWSLTTNGVLMNGIGYCLEALPGQPHGTPLYMDFAGHCGGSRGQVWTYNGSNGQLSSVGACASLAESAASGIQIVRSSCSHATRWSIGYSSVSLHPGPASGPAGGTYTAILTVANAASAQTAYGITTAFTLPAALTVTALRGTGAASTFHCTLPTLTCTGNLPAGTSGDINLTGQLPAGAATGASYSASAHVTVHGTSQLASATHTSALLKVMVSAAAAPVPAAGGGVLPLNLPLLALIVGLLLLCGGILVRLAVRRRAARPAASGHSHAASHASHPHASHPHAARPHAAHPHASAAGQAHPRPQVSDTQPIDAHPQAAGRPHAYEGRRRRRTGPDPVPSAPKPRSEPDPLVRPDRHHPHR